MAITWQERAKARSVPFGGLVVATMLVFGCAKSSTAPGDDPSNPDEVTTEDAGLFARVDASRGHHPPGRVDAQTGDEDAGEGESERDDAGMWWPSDPVDAGVHRGWYGDDAGLTWPYDPVDASGGGGSHGGEDAGRTWPSDPVDAGVHGGWYGDDAGLTWPYDRTDAGDGWWHGRTDAGVDGYELPGDDGVCSVCDCASSRVACECNDASLSCGPTYGPVHIDAWGHWSPSLGCLPVTYDSRLEGQRAAIQRALDAWQLPCSRLRFCPLAVGAAPTDDSCWRGIHFGYGASCRFPSSVNGWTGQYTSVCITAGDDATRLRKVGEALGLVVEERSVGAPRISALEARPWRGEPPRLLPADELAVCAIYGEDGACQ